jgi:hypothetical protein
MAFEALRQYKPHIEQRAALTVTAGLLAVALLGGCSASAVAQQDTGPSTPHIMTARQLDSAMNVPGNHLPVFRGKLVVRESVNRRTSPEIADNIAYSQSVEVVNNPLVVHGGEVPETREPNNKKWYAYVGKLLSGDRLLRAIGIGEKILVYVSGSTDTFYSIDTLPDVEAEREKQFSCVVIDSGRCQFVDVNGGQTVSMATSYRR